MERRRNAEQERDPAAAKRAISAAVDHAEFMHRSGQLSAAELGQFRKLAISQSLDNAVEDHEFDGLHRSGLYDHLSREAGHDENSDPDASEQDRRHIGLKVLSNFISDPRLRDTITTTELDHLKQHGVDLGDNNDPQIHDRLDQLYSRSATPDGALFDRDTGTEDAMSEFERGAYAGSRAERPKPRPAPPQVQGVDEMMAGLDRGQTKRRADDLTSKGGKRSMDEIMREVRGEQRAALREQQDAEEAAGA